MNKLATLLLVSCFTCSLYSQSIEPTEPRATEDWAQRPRSVAGELLQWKIPSDAIILLGENTDQWTKMDGSPAEWTMEAGIMTVKPGTGDIVSKASFGDCHLHMEWRSPLVIKGNGQGRGNSGVFLASRYEVQVLDCDNNETYFNGQAGSIYKQHPPLANACNNTGEWNSYDIIFKAPKWDLFGNKLESGRLTLIHNGVVVQNNAEIAGTTEYIGYPKNLTHGGAPLKLQDHGDLVSYRNIWIRRL